MAHDAGDEAPRRAAFHHMTEGTREDWMIIAGHAAELQRGLPDRIMAHLKLLEGDFGGFAVDRLQHCLQTATRAHRDGRDEEYVVCALLHDIGDILGPHNHADIAAAILQPFVSEQNHWMVKHHGIFQGYYFFEFLGLDKHMRDRFKDSPYYDATVEFCHEYDQKAFEPGYPSLTLQELEPMLRRVLGTPKSSIYLRGSKAGAGE